MADVFRVGDYVRVSPNARLVTGALDPYAGEYGVVLKVHTPVFLHACRVRFADGTEEEILADRLIKV